MLADSSSFADHSLDANEVNRYSRQLLLPEIGVQGQEALKNGKVLIVGAGGLGCPVAIYLASAGVGELGLVDYDEVELNNLHRQIGHNVQRLHKSKADSLKETVLSLNSNIQCTSYHRQLIDKEAAIDLINRYDVVCDCSDNVPTRYMLNDACVQAGKPLVSGSALRWEGQLTVYNYGQDCPCYRCIFPKPPPAETVTSCSEGGVLGAVCGLIGSLQALETLKILTKIGPSFAGKLLLFNGLTCEFRPIRLRKKNASCESCGSSESVISVTDYEEFCCSKACDKIHPVHILPDIDRISVTELKNVVANTKDRLLVDCRPANEYEICRLQSSINLPLSEIEAASNNKSILSILKDSFGDGEHNSREVFMICHRGNDSQKAVVKLRELLALDNEFVECKFIFKDVIGGLDSWSTDIDPNFPRY